MLLPLVILLVAPAAEPNEAEKLFREMEAKVAKAKNIECAYEIKMEFGKETGSSKGTLLIGEGNKVRVEANGEFAGMKENRTEISDGMKGVLGKDSPASVVPKWLHQAIRASLTRATLLNPGFVVQPGQKPDDSEYRIDERFPVTQFKLGKKEKVGDQEAQVIEYTLTMAGGRKETLAVSVWLDTKTQLPLKRILAATIDDKKMTISETFTKLDLDAKIDPKQFELPKK
jgi:outer membrane lipoprotein-sorting protein